MLQLTDNAIKMVVNLATTVKSLIQLVESGLRFNKLIANTGSNF